MACVQSLLIDTVETVKQSVKLIEEGKLPNPLEGAGKSQLTNDL